jgi:hypothetical protein
MDGDAVTVDPLDLIEEKLHALGKKVKRKQDGLEAQCPAHDDGTPSLSVARGDKRDIILKCFTGCSSEQVMAALGLIWTDLGDSNLIASAPAEYVYRNADGRPVYKVCRGDNKSFWQEHVDGNGAWSKGLGGVTTLPYHLPEVIKAIAAGEVVWITEGEKDADRLAVEGLTSTCNSGGAGSFKPHLAEWFKGATVVLVPDTDDVGEKHMADVRRLLEAQGCTVTTKRAAAGKDAFDHFAAGFSVEQFVGDGETADEWPATVPIGGTLSVASFPVHALSDWMAAQVLDVAQEIDVAPDLPAMIGLATLSAICAKRGSVVVRGAWVEPLNLYLVVAMKPGAGKSPAFKAMTKPLRERQKRLVAEAEAEVAKVEQRRRMVEKAMKRAEDKGDTHEASLQLAELLSIPPMSSPRLMADDATPEAMVKLLSEQGGRLAMMSTEGGLFDIMTGRYSEKANLDPYLMAWSGDEIAVDRIGRGSVIITDPLLTIGLTVQPDVIARLADRPELAGRGLTARFMFSLPPDNVGFRNMIDDPEFDEVVRAAYSARMTDIATELDSYGMAGLMRLSSAAKVTFMKWRQDIEYRKRAGADLYEMREWATKLESSVVRVAGLLHIGDGGRTTDEIGEDVVLRAIEIGDYWMSHARAAHGMWGATETVQGAQVIWQWCVASKITEFSVRDLHRAKQKRFDRVDELINPLELLMDCGYIRPLFEGELKVGKRGAESPRFVVNPLASAPVVTHVIHVTRDKSEAPSSSLENVSAQGTDDMGDNSPSEGTDDMGDNSPSVTILPNGQPYNLDEPWT